jgi:hypothetical protein
VIWVQADPLQVKAGLLQVIWQDQGQTDQWVPLQVNQADQDQMDQWDLLQAIWLVDQGRTDQWDLLQENQVDQDQMDQWDLLQAIWLAIPLSIQPLEWRHNLLKVQVKVVTMMGQHP